MYVYFIRQGRTGAIKIGTAASPEQRLALLQIGNPSELHLIGKRSMPGGYKDARGLEGGLHEQFSLYRIRGEWFAPTKELLDTIAKLSDPPRDDLIRSDPEPAPPSESFEARAKRIWGLRGGAA